MANDVTMKVGVDTKDAEEGFKDVVEMASKSASDAQSKFSDIFKGSFAGGFAADFAGDVKNTLMQGVSAAVEYCEGYRGSVFSKESLKETLEFVYFPKHRAL